jgi:hypothetical protein
MREPSRHRHNVGPRPFYVCGIAAAHPALPHILPLPGIPTPRGPMACLII